MDHAVLPAITLMLAFTL